MPSISPRTAEFENVNQVALGDLDGSDKLLIFRDLNGDVTSNDNSEPEVVGVSDLGEYFLSGGVPIYTTLPTTLKDQTELVILVETPWGEGLYKWNSTESVYDLYSGYITEDWGFLIGSDFTDLYESEEFFARCKFSLNISVGVIIPDGVYQLERPLKGHPNSTYVEYTALNSPDVVVEADITSDEAQTETNLRGKYNVIFECQDGGLLLEHGDFRIEGCLFIGNGAIDDWRGWGCVSYGHTAYIKDCSFHAFTTNYAGFGKGHLQTDFTLTTFTFAEEAGVRISGGSSARVGNSISMYNESGILVQSGGSVEAQGSILKFNEYGVSTTNFSNIVVEGSDCSENTTSDFFSEYRSFINNFGGSATSPNGTPITSNPSLNVEGNYGSIIIT